jgi:hypothetical protein
MRDVAAGACSSPREVGFHKLERADMIGGSVVLAFDPERAVGGRAP